jgi:hypothetical protein
MGASLEILGELKKRVQIQLGGCETRFRCRPVIVRGLTHNLNLSGPFLRQNQIDQLYSRDSLRINGHEVPLLTARGRPAVQRAEVSSAPAYFVKKTILAPNSITMCSLRVPKIVRGIMPPGTASVEGSSQFMNSSNCHPWLLAIVDVKEDGLIKAGVMNTLDQPVTIQSGQQYGKVTLTCEVHEAHSFRARLPNIRPRSSPTSTPTTLTNATLWALLVNSLSGNSPTCHQMAPQSCDRPRNNLGRHLTATREEPEAPSSGNSIDLSSRQGEPPAHTELGAPLLVGHNLVTTRGHHQRIVCSVRFLRILHGSQQGRSLPSQNWGHPLPASLARPQGTPPDQAEIGTSSHCRRDPVDLKKAQLLLLAYWDVLRRHLAATV